ncbi:MAG: transcriptional regulator [Candidatus Hydrothermarchaeales archaeon]
MKCEECGGDVSTVEDCELAKLKRVIDGNEYSFCCYHCAKSFEEKKD